VATLERSRSPSGQALGRCRLRYTAVFSIAFSVLAEQSTLWVKKELTRSSRSRCRGSFVNRWPSWRRLDRPQARRITRNDTLVRWGKPLWATPCSQCFGWWGSSTPPVPDGSLRDRHPTGHAFHRRPGKVRHIVKSGVAVTAQPEFVVPVRFRLMRDMVPDACESVAVPCVHITVTCEPI